MATTSSETRTDERGKQSMRMQRFQILLGSIPTVRAVRCDEHERKQQAERGDSAVGRNDDCADVEENWVHLSKNSLSGQKVGRTRPTGP